MAKWICTYEGRKATLSASGVAAPSWGSFDARIWWRDIYRVELHNMMNEARASGQPAPFWRMYDKNGQLRCLTRYRVELADSKTTVRWEGPSWQVLVKEAKSLGEELLGTGESLASFMEDRMDDTILSHLGVPNSHALLHWILKPRTFADTPSNVLDSRGCYLDGPQLADQIKRRLQWLYKHGFIYHTGKVGKGTRWAVT